MSVVTNIVTDPEGEPIVGANVAATLVDSDLNQVIGYLDDGTILGRVSFITGTDGAWSFDLVPNADITPGNTYWLVTEFVAGSLAAAHLIEVGVAGPYGVLELLVATPQDLDPTVMAAHLAQYDHSAIGAVEIGVAMSDETTAITTGTAKTTIRMPFAMTLTAVRASLSTASSSGIPTVDINESGSTILSTKLTIDASEKTSATASTAAVISDSSLVNNAEITFDIDVAGTGATGLKCWLIGTRS